LIAVKWHGQIDQADQDDHGQDRDVDPPECAAQLGWHGVLNARALIERSPMDACAISVIKSSSQRVMRRLAHNV
jgi:hypothetical protein